MEKLTGIQVLIWDFDGTFYPIPDGLAKDVRESEYSTIIKHTGWTREKAIEEFLKIYKVVTPSATEVVARLTKIPTPQAAIETETYFDRTKYLQPDPKLIETFEKLKGYRHFILGNGAVKYIIIGIKALGLTPTIFEEIVTSEIVGENKPSTKGYEYILKKTGLSAPHHLMIGDREAVDLAPAKKVGMMTCLISPNSQVISVDRIVASAYDIPNIIS